MPSIAGIGPEQAWTFLYVLVCLLILIPSGIKIVEFIQKQMDRKKEKETRAKQETEGTVIGLEDRLEKIENRLSDIDKKLDRDNRRLNDLESKTESIQEGFRALCTANLAILNKLGNDEEIQHARKGLETYLINK